MGVLESKPPPDDAWASTRWSVVAGLSEPQRETRESAWVELLAAYRAPMVAYVRRVLGRVLGREPSEKHAEDVVQSFLLGCVEKGWLSKAHPDRGSFRRYVRVLLKRFAWAYVKYLRAKRRSPPSGIHLFPLMPEDDGEIGLPSAAQESVAFDRSWIQVAVDRALARLREESARYHEVVVDLLVTHGDGSPDLAERLRVQPATLPVLRHRSRRRFAERLKEELVATVADRSELEGEWTLVRRALP